MCVVGAVLAAPGLLGACAPPDLPVQEPPRPGAHQAPARQPRGPEAPAPAPPEPPEAPGQEAQGTPEHPCELVTLMRVPCSEPAQACEYTYWQCPLSVKPLRA
jgi:hypothetical protein